MKIYFDTEFTGLHKNTTLISIGLISESGNDFYAELTDYDKEQTDGWIQENVIKNLTIPDDETDQRVNTFKGDSEYVKEKLLSWLSQFKTVEWVSDVCHYDFVLLIDLLYGHALKIPYGVHNAACHDINQDIAREFNIDEIKAFDMSREHILKVYGIEISGEKHNALYDARVIKSIYENVRR